MTSIPLARRGEGGDLNAGASGKRLGKSTGNNGIHRGELSEIDEENGRFQDVGEVMSFAARTALIVSQTRVVCSVSRRGRASLWWIEGIWPAQKRDAEGDGCEYGPTAAGRPSW